MSKLSYVKGNVLEPQGPGIKLIPHICNDAGKWGAGFVVALSERFPEPEEMYRSVAELQLGDVHYTPVGDDETPLVVANMIAQHDTGMTRLEMLARDGAWHNDSPELNGFDKIGTGRDRPPIRYGALSTCMRQVGKYAEDRYYRIHAPRFGAGLAGGDWDVIEMMIFEHWVDHDIEVTIYDLE